MNVISFYVDVPDGTDMTRAGYSEIVAPTHVIQAMRRMKGSRTWAQFLEELMNPAP
jgi:hypothetical protein